MKVTKPATLFPDDEAEDDAPEAIIGADPSRLVVFNTLSNKKEPFTPVHPGAVSIYSNDVAADENGHIGQARNLISFDIIGRYLQAIGYDVTFSRDQTGIDEAFDIHAGTSDSSPSQGEADRPEAAAGTPACNYWLQGGALDTSDALGHQGLASALKTSSKVSDITQVYDAEVVRTFVLTSHYRAPMACTDKLMGQAQAQVEYLYTSLHRINMALAKSDRIPDRGNIVSPAKQPIEAFFERFHAAMCDDFDFPAALAAFSAVAKAANELTKSKKKPRPDIAYTLAAARSVLFQAGEVLGILQAFPSEALERLRDKRASALGIDSAEVTRKLMAREEARADRDWALADLIREGLSQEGIEIMDNPEGTDWRIAPTL